MKRVHTLTLAALLAVASFIPVTSIHAADAASTATAVTMAASVKARLDAEPALKGADITVLMSGTTVTLKGTMTSPVARVKAVEIAKATEGVTKVVNKISLAK